MIQRLVLPALATTLAACGSIQLRGTSNSAAAGDRQLPPPSTAAASRESINTEVRRVCRSSRPRGWIAIDFVADSTRCAATPGRKNEHTVALVIAFEHYAIGRELETCIGERIPTNWIRTREITDASRCPTDEPDAKPDQPTVVVIRRTK